MTKYFRKSLFLILSMISVITMFSILVSEIANENEILQMQGYTYPNNISFSISSYDNLPKELENKKVTSFSEDEELLADENFSTKLDNFFRDLMKDKDIVIKVVDGKRFTNGFYTNGLYLNNDYENNYKLIEGRFLSKDDFINEEKVAVIPETAIKYTEEVNGVKYINSGYEKYKVIGVLHQNKSNTASFNTIFYNLTKNDLKSLNTQEIILESKTYSKDDLINKVENNGYLNITHFNDIPTSKFGLRGFIKPFVFKFATLYFPVIIVILLTLILSMNFWINEVKYEIGVMKVCGANNLQILKDIIIKLALISIISMITCPIIQTILEYSSILNRSIAYGPINFFMNLIFTMLVCIILILIVSVKIDKIEPVDLIKRR